MKKPYTRQTLIDWLNNNANKRVELTVLGTQVVLRGTTAGVETLDACSTEIQECEMDTGVKGLQVALVMHEHALGIQVVASGKGQPRLSVSVPMSVPYASVKLESEKEAKKPSHEDVVYTPYELLHSNSN